MTKLGYDVSEACDSCGAQAGSPCRHDCEVRAQDSNDHVISDLRAEVESFRAARIRATDALRGVQATEAGGFTGDPVVDGIGALRAELDTERAANLTLRALLAEAVSGRYDTVQHLVDELTKARGEVERLRALCTELRKSRDHFLDKLTDCHDDRREAERIASLAMAEGMRWAEALRRAYRVIGNHWGRTRATPEQMAQTVIDECCSALRDANDAWELCGEAEQIANVAMAEGLRAVEQEAAEADALSDALDARTQRCDREMRELAEATGVAWRGLTHEDVVALVRSRRERAEKVVSLALAWKRAERVGGHEEYVAYEALSAALAAYEEGR